MVNVICLISKWEERTSSYINTVRLEQEKKRKKPSLNFILNLRTYRFFFPAI